MKRSLKNPLLCGIFLTGAVLAVCVSLAKKQEPNEKSDSPSSAQRVLVSPVATNAPSVSSAFNPTDSHSETPKSDRASHSPSALHADAGIAPQARHNDEGNTAATPQHQTNSGRAKRQNRHIPYTLDAEASDPQPLPSNNEMVAMDSETHAPDVLPPAIAAGQPVVEEALPPLSLAVPDEVYDTLTKTEQETIRSQGEKFVDSIHQSPDADPESPAYFDHWKSARRLHDEHLRITLGWDRFNQLSAAAAAAAEAKKAESSM